MKVPDNSAATLLVELQGKNQLLALKIEDAKRSYAEFINTAQNDITKNMETISALKTVAIWSEIDDLPINPS
jgi:hypothetical protein